MGGVGYRRYKEITPAMRQFLKENTYALKHFCINMPI
jgi:hypothetical protein